jgi:hypothetical protein
VRSPASPWRAIAELESREPPKSAKNAPRLHAVRRGASRRVHGGRHNAPVVFDITSRCRAVNYLASRKPRARRPMKKGGPKAAPSPADLQRDAHRGDIAASFRGLAPTPLKADRRSYNATVVSQWSRALTSSTTVQIRATKRAAEAALSPCTGRRTYAAPATLRSSCRTAGASLCS